MHEHRAAGSDPGAPAHDVVARRPEAVRAVDVEQREQALDVAQRIGAHLAHVPHLLGHAGSDRGPQEFDPDAVRGDADHAAFRANLAAAGVAGRVRHVRKMSADALGDVEGPLALLYVDGAHRFGPARDDVARWGARVAPGGTMLVHDSFSSIGVTGALLAECVARGGWRYAGRTGSLAEYRRLAAPLRGRERSRDAARQLAQLPWFARNVLFKVLVTARLRPVAHRLGLPAGMHWPY